ncbi:MAG TPA: hypothetical protein VL334_08960 [Anaerolineae bacterium]|nr:hypothetical protein [Anaerolineae bacterium]
MSENANLAQHEASKRYQSARRKLFVHDLLNLVRGRAPELLSFDSVQAALQAWQQVERREPEMVPLNKIVGSVGRYRDFTREFLPKGSINQERWRAVDAAMHSQAGLPPIELYQVGEAYFVRDGNHRVSVAHANGLKDIEAYVTRLETPVSIDSSTRSEDLLLKAGLAEFLRRTHLEDLRPNAEVEVTEVGSYYELLQHIEVHRYYLGIELKRAISWEEAVTSWYDSVYLPVAAAIWASSILDRFPGRTPADLYLWVCRHREDLVREGGDLPSPVAAVTDLTAELDGSAGRVTQSVRRVLGSKPKTADLAAEAVELTKQKPVTESTDSLSQ